MNTSLKKTIVVNPELFKMSRKKTKKQSTVAIKPTISTTKLKKKMMKRIMDIKNNEINNQDTSETNIHQQSQEQQSQEQPVEHLIKNNELNDSVNFMKEFKKQQQMNAHKQMQLTKTIKHHNNINNNQETQPIVNIELPAELDTDSIELAPINNIPVQIDKYTSSHPPPYGCLKGGHKQTYRNWRKKTNIEQPIVNNHIKYDIPNNIPKTAVESIQKSTQIKQKLIQKEQKNKEHSQEPVVISEIDDNNNMKPSIDNILNDYDAKNNKHTNNHIKRIKQTTTRKYKLGKSTLSKKISVLIKNNKTKKHILNAQKKLKLTDINDIKTYLKQQGLIKIGSTCPNDILRKMFETTMITGDVTNTNSNTILHNFTNK